MHDEGKGNALKHSVIYEIQHMAKMRHQECLKEQEELEKHAAQIEAHHQSLKAEAASLRRIIEAAHAEDEPSPQSRHSAQLAEATKRADATESGVAYAPHPWLHTEQSRSGYP